MQSLSATQHGSDAPPVHPAREPDLDYFSSLGFDTDVYNSFLGEFLTSGGHAWDGSFGGDQDSEYVPLVAPASSGTALPLQPDLQAIAPHAPSNHNTTVNTFYDRYVHE